MLQTLSRPLRQLALQASVASSQASCSYAVSSISSEGHEEHAALVNKLLYRSRQRGFLELDLLMGKYAERELPRMGGEQLQQFSGVLDEENPDLFKWLTGQLPPPERLLANPAFRALTVDVAEQLRKASGAAATPKGRDWLRGWDDAWRDKSTAPAADGEAAGQKP